MSEKYLNIKLVGHEVVKAFLNRDKIKNPKAPDFKGDGVAVWINEKQEKSQISSNENQDMLDKLKGGFN